LVTLRPGTMQLLPTPDKSTSSGRAIQTTSIVVPERGRVRLLSDQRNDELEVLAQADVVIGVGMGVLPSEYELLSPLAELFGAELAATRKVTDRGWAPRARQVGITGRSIAPRIYFAIGLSGKFNHMVGVRGAGTIVAINNNSAAPVFEHCDIGLVGDWREVVHELQRVLLGGAPSFELPEEHSSHKDGAGSALPKELNAEFFEPDVDASIPERFGLGGD
jgi:electron transfer flavoprotein alpha subunit